MPSDDERRLSHDPGPPPRSPHSELTPPSTPPAEIVEDGPGRRNAGLAVGGCLVVLALIVLVSWLLGRM